MGKYIPYLDEIRYQYPQYFIDRFRIDRPDDRDFLFQLQALSVPVKIDNRNKCTSVKNQGNEGACVGFGTCSTYEVLWNIKHGKPNIISIFLGNSNDRSDRMAYEEAKKNDEWPGEDYEGSSLKGGAKGAHKVGICHEKFWKYVAQQKGSPLPGAYENAKEHRISKYERIVSRDNLPELINNENPKNIDLPLLEESTIEAIKQAIYKHGAVLGGVLCHNGWFSPESDGTIPYSPYYYPVGGHAISFVGYDDDRKVLILKNSWGTEWGAEGYGLLSYEDARKHLISAFSFTL